ncbi:MAG: 8-oxo-dGTP diphosphatase MutT [Bacilli bacterium]|nr:8-oxo-dGTP diphosphatase MutT [Bacilli bacterium]
MIKQKYIEVVGAVFINDRSEVLCTRRKNYSDLALKWEFPGGKIEEGESHEEALIREIKEELDIKIKVDDFFMTVNYEYENFHIILHTYLCTIVSGKVMLLEHEESTWASVTEIGKLDWAAADLPIVKKLINNLQ